MVYNVYRAKITLNHKISFILYSNYKTFNNLYQLYFDKIKNNANKEEYVSITDTINFFLFNVYLLVYFFNELNGLLFSINIYLLQKGIFKIQQSIKKIIDYEFKALLPVKKKLLKYYIKDSKKLFTIYSDVMIDLEITILKLAGTIFYFRFKLNKRRLE
jgi:hypothetical protein